MPTSEKPLALPSEMAVGHDEPARSGPMSWHWVRVLCGKEEDSSGDKSGGELERAITIRQLIFIALGGSIGAGLFVGSGGALSVAGPLSLVLNFAIVGFGVTCAMGALGELSATYPVAGSFYTYSTRFVSEAWGFSMGWNFAFNWLIIFPFELTCIATQVRFWSENIHPATVITPILIVVMVAAMMGSRWYGEVEHIFGIGKSAAIMIFIFMAFCIIGGAVPTDPRNGTGTMYWQPDTVFKNGISGFMFVFRTAGMSYGGTELLGMTAAECQDPRRGLPLATKFTFGRVVVFYIVSLLLVGFCISANDKALVPDEHGAGISPFTLAAERANIKYLPTMFNGFIVLALVSMANASVFASSRAIQALCTNKMGPKWFAKIKFHVPLHAYILTFLFALLAFINLAPGGGVIFEWLLSLSGACNYYSWISICASHICFRRGWKAQGRNTDELLWKSPFGVAGSWVGLSICIFALLSNVVTAILPVTATYSKLDVFRDNVGTVIPWCVFGAYLAWTRFKRPGTKQHILIPPQSMDLVKGARMKNESTVVVSSV